MKYLGEVEVEGWKRQPPKSSTAKKASKKASKRAYLSKEMCVLVDGYHRERRLEGRKAGI